MTGNFTITKDSISSKREQDGENKEKPNSDLFTVSVIGVPGSGKSTLINTLVGENILPTLALTEPIPVNVVSDGKGKAEIVNTEHYVEIEMTPKQLCDFITIRNGHSNYYFFSKLYNDGYRFNIHTNKSFGKLNPARYIKYSYSDFSDHQEPVNNANAIIYTMNATRALTHEDCRYISENLSGKNDENLFLVFTHTDNLYDSGVDSGVFMNYAHEITQKRFGFDDEFYASRIFFVDARKGDPKLEEELIKLKSVQMKCNKKI